MPSPKNSISKSLTYFQIISNNAIPDLLCLRFPQQLLRSEIHKADLKVIGKNLVGLVSQCSKKSKILEHDEYTTVCVFIFVSLSKNHVYFTFILGNFLLKKTTRHVLEDFRQNPTSCALGVAAVVLSGSGVSNTSWRRRRIGWRNVACRIQVRCVCVCVCGQYLEHI